MKSYLTNLLLFMSVSVSMGQRIPALVSEKVRINSGEKNIVVEIGPTERDVKIDVTKVYYWYGANLIHATQGGYDGHLLNGVYTEYYLNKNLKQQGSFKKGLKDNTWKDWTPEGTLVKTETWKRGVLAGPFSYYDNQGRLSQSGNYRRGLKSGLVNNYFAPDSLQRVYYINGKPVVRPSFLRRINIFHKKY